MLTVLHFQCRYLSISYFLYVMVRLPLCVSYLCMSLKELHTRLRSRPFFIVSHTEGSHCTGLQKWRWILPLSRGLCSRPRLALEMMRFSLGLDPWDPHRNRARSVPEQTAVRCAMCRWFSLGWLELMRKRKMTTPPRRPPPPRR